MDVVVPSISQTTILELILDSTDNFHTLYNKLASWSKNDSEARLVTVRSDGNELTVLEFGRAIESARFQL